MKDGEKKPRTTGASKASGSKTTQARRPLTPMPWIERQTAALLRHPAQARLLHGPAGTGQFELGMALVRARLCEEPTPEGACGHCPSCHMIDVHTHPDLRVLMPEVRLIERGWAQESETTGEDGRKRKPSGEIRIDAMRAAIEWTQRTGVRGHGKAMLIEPAEKMNTVTANALLKTLEEPPGDVLFVLCSEASHALLPTIRSRCFAHTMLRPPPDEAQAWLIEQGVPKSDAPMLLRLAGGLAQAALDDYLAGHNTQTWTAWVRACVRGTIDAENDLTPAQTVAAQQKLCHDLMRLQVGEAPLYFEAELLPRGSRPPHALPQWWRQLQQAARTVEHPLNPSLLLDDLAAQAHAALSR